MWWFLFDGLFDRDGLRSSGAPIELDMAWMELSPWQKAGLHLIASSAAAGIT
jgi:hypothetical protein